MLECSRNEVRGQGQQSHSDPKMVRNTPPSQDASTQQNLDSFLKQCRRYAPGALILEIRSKVKATVTQKWYLTLFHPKMHPHTKFGMPTSNNIGDMAWTRNRYTGPRSAVGNVSGYRCVSDCRSRGREFDPGPVPYFRGD